MRLSGAKNTKLTLSYDPKIWTVATEKPSTCGMEYESFKTKWDSRPVVRIILTNTELKQKGKYKVAFEVK